MTHTLVLPKRNSSGGSSGGAHRMSGNTYGGHFNHIDGLRGVAILMVVIFHLFIFKVSSGVDIFLFISGVFLLSSQINNFSGDKQIHITQSLLRIIRRLTPNMVVITGAGTLILMFIYAPSDWWDVFRDAQSSMLYVINWKLTYSGEQYTSIGNNPSAFQHLWSMSVQFQIFISVIVLTYIVSLICKHNKQHMQRVLYPLIAVLSVASFSYATYMHNINQLENYYSTFSRFWEIGVGILCGFVVTNHVVLTRWLRIVAGLAGIVLISWTGIFFDGVNQFPGALTLVPLSGAFLIIWSGISYEHEERTLSNLGVAKILEHPVFLFIGKISYSLYLWHWIIGIALRKVMEGNNVYVINTCVIIISVLLSIITSTYVDIPLRQGKKPLYANAFSFSYVQNSLFRSRRYLKIGAVLVIIIWLLNATSVYAFQGYNNYKSYRADSISKKYGGFFNAYPGARAIINEDYPRDVGVEPNPHDDIFSMMPVNWYDGCYTGSGDDQVKLTKDDGSPCYYGDVTSQKTLYLIGGSHSEQYLTALDNIGKKRNIRVVPIIKMGCPLVNEGKWDGSDFSDCDRWSENALTWMEQNPPTVGFFITSTRPTTLKGQGVDRVPDNYVTLFERLSAIGKTIYAVRDNPWIMVKDTLTHKTVDIQLNARNCISGGGTSVECGNRTEDVLAEVNPALEAYKGIPHVKHIDFSPLLCFDGNCPAVIGNVLVYRDSNHFTDVFVQSMEPFIESAIFEDGWDADKVRRIMSEKDSQDITTENKKLPDWVGDKPLEDLGESVPFVNNDMTETPLNDAEHASSHGDIHSGNPDGTSRVDSNVIIPRDSDISTEPQDIPVVTSVDIPPEVVPDV